MMFCSWVSMCKIGLDHYGLVNTSTYQCMRNANYTSVTVRASFNHTGIDPNATQTLINAKNAGMDTDIYILPCRSRPASLIVQ